MDVNQQQNPPMSGDDELAKALEGGLQFEETPVPGAANQTVPAPATSQAPTLSPTPPVAGGNDQMPSLDPSGGEDTAVEAPEPAAQPEVKEPTPKPEAPTIQHHTKNHTASAPKNAKTEAPTKSSGGLDKLKASALEELRPLVGKLKLPAEEKFDTLLLIIRTTDDQSLLDEAHAAAKEISDETRRAQALLDVIKEIDYFSSKR